jgi:hypothetical protein
MRPAIANVNDPLIFRGASVTGKADAIMEVADPRMLADGSLHGCLDWHPVSQRPSINQNVAGLWLLYGANAPETGTSGRRTILPHDATIC